MNSISTRWLANTSDSDGRGRGKHAVCAMMENDIAGWTDSVQREIEPAVRDYTQGSRPAGSEAWCAWKTRARAAARARAPVPPPHTCTHTLIVPVAVRRCIVSSR